MRGFTVNRRWTTTLLSCLWLAFPSIRGQSGAIRLLDLSAGASLEAGPRTDGTGLITAGLSRTPNRVVIRTYDTFGVEFDEMTQTRSVVEGIIEEASVQALWRDCSTDGDPESVDMMACRQPLASNELMVRIVAAPKSSRIETLGESMVECQEKKGVLATVYADRIHSLADRIRVGRGRLFGRAVAHEIGHLLLGTSRHAHGGLMRAHWSDTELQRDIDADWMWSRQEVVDIVRSIQARIRPAVTASIPVSETPGLRPDHGAVCR